MVALGLILSTNGIELNFSNNSDNSSLFASVVKEAGRIQNFTVVLDALSFE